MHGTRKPVHPGVVFWEDVLVPLSLSITAAATALGVTRGTLSDFVHGKTALSPALAIRIAKVTHTTPESWLAMQMKLTLWQAAQCNTIEVQNFPELKASA
jgi:addiction module HigA family antidote